jgi:hypothetical protein
MRETNGIGFFCRKSRGFPCHKRIKKTETHKTRRGEEVAGRYILQSVVDRTIRTRKNGRTLVEISKLTGPNKLEINKGVFFFYCC